VAQPFDLLNKDMRRNEGFRSDRYDVSGRDVDRPNFEAQEVNGVKYKNFSGKSLSEVLHWFPGDLKAEQVILLPDLCPGRSPLPTGCCVEFKESSQSDWRKFALSDVGCGMQVLESGLDWEEFDDRRGDWDEVYRRIKANRNSGRPGDLGSGNHFIDAVSDENERVLFVVHTGSRDEGRDLEGLVGSQGKFDKKFSEVTSWAKSNRTAIAEILQRKFGPLELVLDKPHNLYKRGDGTVIIRKGAVRLDTNDMTVIPSSMDGDMVLVSGTEMMSFALNGMSHGTGRIKSRGESSEDAQSFDFDSLRQRVYIPDGITDMSIRKENPDCYRDLGSCLGLIEGLVRVESRLTPIAYIGQV